jgi:hypothetical protein
MRETRMSDSDERLGWTGRTEHVRGGAGGAVAGDDAVHVVEDEHLTLYDTSCYI